MFGIIGLSREFNKIMIFVERQKKALQSHRVLNEVGRYLFHNQLGTCLENRVSSEIIFKISFLLSAQEWNSRIPESQTLSLDETSSHAELDN